MKLTTEQRDEMISAIIENILTRDEDQDIASIFRYGIQGYETYTDEELQDEYNNCVNEEVSE